MAARAQRGRLLHERAARGRGLLSPDAEAPGAAPRAGSALRRISANAASQAVADVVGKLAVLVMYAVIARQLGASPLGYLTLAQSIALLLQLCGLGTDPLVIAEVARARDRAAVLLWDSLLIKGVLGGAAGVVIVAVTLLSGSSAAIVVTFVLFTVSGLLDLAAGTLMSLLRGAEHMVAVARSQLAQRVVTTGLAVWLLLAGADMVAVGAAYLVGSLVAGASLLRSTRRVLGHLPLALDPGRARAFGIASWPLALGTAFGALLARADAVLLAMLTTSTVVGVYGAAYRVMESTFFLSWAIGVAIFPVLSRLGPETDPTIGRAFGLASRFTYAALLPLGAVLVLFPRSIVERLFGDGFASSAGPLRWLGVVAALYGLGAIATYTQAALDRRRAIAWVSVGALLVNVVANLVLIPPFGAEGAAAAMALAQVVYTVAATADVVRHTGGVSVLRLALLPTASAAAMVAARLAVGDTIPGIVLSVVVYAAVLVLAHARIYPDDQRLLTAWLRRATPRAAGAAT